MNCYNHSETPAVGICKHCNKGVCPDCLSDTGDGLACKDHCLAEVKLMNNHNKKVIKGTAGNWRNSGLLYLGMGLIFILTTIFLVKKIDPFLSAMGLLCIGYGLYLIVQGRVYKEDPTDF